MSLLYLLLLDDIIFKNRVNILFTKYFALEKTKKYMQTHAFLFDALRPLFDR